MALTHSEGLSRVLWILNFELREQANSPLPRLIQFSVQWRSLPPSASIRPSVHRLLLFRQINVELGSKVFYHLISGGTKSFQLLCS